MSNTNCVDYEDIKVSSEYKSEYIIELQKENQRYKQALKFYAEPYNHSVDNIQKDRGLKARKALEGEE